jgi:hypothetical protein
MKLHPRLAQAASGHLLALAIGVMAPLAAPVIAPAAAPDEPVRTQAKHAYWRGDFDALEKLNDELKRGPHFDIDGGLELEQFRSGIGDVAGGEPKHTEAYLRELEALTLQWAAEHPKSALPHILHAEVLMKHAWSYRGSGYANEVTPQAWADFTSYLRQAVNYLNEHADVALTDSYAHDILLIIGMGLGWDASQMESIAEDGLKRNPDDISLYFSRLTTLLPKWGGNARTLDKYIRQAAERTRAQHGMSMYARLYSAAAEEQYSHALFENSYADWALVKQGYEDMLARFPKSVARRTRFAYMACIARDKKTLRSLLDQIGPDIETRHWGINPERTLEGCQRWAREADAAEAAPARPAPEHSGRGL